MEKNNLTQRRKGAKTQRESNNLSEFFLVNLCAFAPLRLCVLILLFASAALAQPAPTVEKIEPPNWWLNSSINPVRVMIRGKNLTGAKIESVNPTIAVSNPKASANGNYYFLIWRLRKTRKSAIIKLKSRPRMERQTRHSGFLRRRKDWEIIRVLRRTT